MERPSDEDKVTHNPTSDLIHICHTNVTIPHNSIVHARMIDKGGSGSSIEVKFYLSVYGTRGDEDV